LSEANKRVRITYTVEMEEVPSRIAGLLREAEKDAEALVRQLSDAASHLDSDDNANKAIVVLEHVRQGMMKVDLRLDDCQNLLVGYQSATAEFNKINLDPQSEEIAEGVPDE